MTVVVRAAPTRTVVTVQQEAVTALEAAARPVSIIQRQIVGVVADRSDVTNVAGVGMRGGVGDQGALGPPGPKGLDGMADIPPILDGGNF